MAATGTLTTEAGRAARSEPMVSRRSSAVVEPRPGASATAPGSIGSSVAAPTRGVVPTRTAAPAAAGRWPLIAGASIPAQKVEIGVDHAIDAPSSVDHGPLSPEVRERHENTQWDDFSPSEKVMHARRIEVLEGELAKQRQGTRTDLQPPAKLAGSPEPEYQRTARARTAKAVGTSHGTLAKARHVIDTAEDPDTPPEVAQVAKQAAANLSQPGAVVDHEHRAGREAEQGRAGKSTHRNRPQPAGMPANPALALPGRRNRQQPGATQQDPSDLAVAESLTAA